MNFIHVQYTRTESDRLGYTTVRLTGSPIARGLEKYSEVFIEGVKFWRIDSVGHGRTRPVSVCVGSTERKSDRERKNIEVLTEGVKCWRIDSVGHDPSLFVLVRLSGSPIARDLEKYTEVFTEGVEC